MTRSLTGGLTGMAVAVAAALLMARLQGGLSSAIALVSLGLGAGCGGWLAWKTDLSFLEDSPTPGVWTRITAAAWILFSLRAFLWWIYPDGRVWKVLSPHNLGDASLHITLIRFLARGGDFWNENPILSGVPLRYPVGVDAFNSLLLLVGIPLERGLIWVGLLGALATGWALLRWGGGFTLTGFLCNGGLAGFAVFAGATLKEHQADLAWKSLPLCLLVPQRGFLFAFPAGLLLLTHWRRQWQSPQSPAMLPRLAELTLYALMPLFHLHTFLFLSFFLLAGFIFLPPARGPALRMVVWALVPATLAVGTVADLRDAGGMLAWHPGWMRGEESLTGFWLGNFGLMLPMTVWLLWKGLPRLNRFDRLCACFGAGLFLLCAWIRFAPWAWDNIKLMVWAYLLILPSLYRGLLAMRPLWQRSAWMFLLFFSGALALLNGLGPSHGYPLISRPELDGVAALLRDLPPGSRVAAVPTYNHPVLLNGQAVAAGYPGHLWSHGYDATASLADLQTLMTGGEGWRVAAARLRVEYIFWGPLESHTYGWIVPVWRFELPLERYSDYGELIRLPSLTTETPATGTP